METHVNLICKICNNSLENKPFKIKEMHFGTFQMFDYFECVACKCIQIVNVPKNMHEHYPEDYYSYSFLPKRKNAIVDILTIILKRELVKYYSGKLNLIGFMTSWFYKNPFPWLIGDLANFNARFLEVFFLVYVGVGLGFDFEIYICNQCKFFLNFFRYP